MTVGYDPKRSSWYYVIDLPRGTDGKRRQAKKRGFATEEVARAAERDILARVAATRPAAAGTVQCALDTWLRALCVDLSPTTIQGHRTKFTNYVYPHIGLLPLHRVTGAVLTSLYADLLRGGGRGGRPLAPSSVLSVHKALVSGLRASGLEIKEKDVRKPKGKMGRRGVWTDEQAGSFLRAVRPHRLYAAYALALTCAMRRGELAGLRWEDIDLAAGVIHVRNQRTAVDREDGGVVERGPKGTSTRDIAIGPILVALLQEYWQRWEQERADAGTKWQNTGGYVFCSKGGRPYYPGHLARTFTRLAAEAGLPVICLHDARHSSATVGLSAGVDVKTMQGRLGHADAATTIDVYGHPVARAEREAALIMENRMLLAPGASDDPPPAPAA